MRVHVVIAGGGTGGHLFPGLAVAEELSKRGITVSFVGTSRGLEATLVPQYGYAFYEINVAGFKGKGALQKIKSILQLPRSAWQARRLLARLAPQVVIGVGGYASGPMALIAAYYGIPVALLEQNSVPGITNRIASRFAKEVFISFPESAHFFPKGHCQLTGNPIRSNLLQATWVPRHASQPIRILVLGGSLGAHSVNQLVVSSIAILAQNGLPFTIVHQTGKTDEGSIRAQYRNLGLSEPQVKVIAFIEDMASAYAHADLVIGRAGATTIAEITAMGLPSILIPLPSAADDHQTHNARFLEKAKAADVLVQNQTNPEQLAKLIDMFVGDPARLVTMADASKKQSRPQAAHDIADRITSWLSS